MSNSNLKTQQNADLADLLCAAREGDQTAYAVLLERYAPMLQSMVSKYAAYGMSEADLEDLRQEASVAFCSAAKTYDPARQGVEFGLYAKICIGHRLSSARTTFCKYCSRGVLSLEGENLIEQNPELLGCEDSVTEALINEERMEALQRLIQQNLSSYESRVWWMYVSGLGTAHIAQTLGKDEKSVSNAIYRIRKKLRQVLEKGDNP